MMTGSHGTFVISWTQTELDGLSAPPMESLVVGAQWRWLGQTTRLDGPGDVLVLEQSAEVTRLRQQAARVVQRLVYAALDQPHHERVAVADDPLLDSGFSVTDGLRNYTGTIIEVPERQNPLIMFLGVVPPEGVDLWVTSVSDNALHANRTGDPTPHVICFTPETRIATGDGERSVGELCEDDLVQTKDDGLQPVRWIGNRRISGARFAAMPELRPIRIRADALGQDRPDSELLVSPQHRLLLTGAVARELFNEHEVLATAKDLVNDHSVLRDRYVTSITYVHLLLDRHQIVFANGVETESFHPACMPLDAVAPDQRYALLDRVPGLERDGSAYGAFARRMLSSAEAAIMLHGTH